MGQLLGQGGGDIENLKVLSLTASWSTLTKLAGTQEQNTNPSDQQTNKLKNKKYVSYPGINNPCYEAASRAGGGDIENLKVLSLTASWPTPPK